MVDKDSQPNHVRESLETGGEWQKQVEYWLGTARKDLKRAKNSLTFSDYEYVGFGCQQALEKTLKAVIAKTGKFPPKSHDLIRLADLANLNKLLSPEQEQLLHDLYPFNLEARYPSIDMDVMGLDENKCNEYIAKTEAMFKWIQEKLGL